MPDFDYTCEHLLRGILGDTKCSGKTLACGCCADCGCFCGYADGTWELGIDDDDRMVYRPKRETP